MPPSEDVDARAADRQEAAYDRQEAAYDRQEAWAERQEAAWHSAPGITLTQKLGGP